MYLSRLHISKFRVFDDITLYFKNGINILIGENNSGKTAIIDALRICLGCGKPDNFIYVQDGDLHVSTNYATILNNPAKYSVDNNEELRIVYVACTRPKKMLWIAVPSDDIDCWRNKLF